MGNAQEAVEDYEREYKKMARRIREKEDRTHSRSELPGRYMAKVLYGWDDGKFEREYLKKLERNWNRWNVRIC